MLGSAGTCSRLFTITQGYILGQYGLLYALEHPELVSRLLILNTPLSPKTKLRPELAAYKSPLPFMRPGNVSDPHPLLNAPAVDYWCCSALVVLILSMWQSSMWEGPGHA